MGYPVEVRENQVADDSRCSMCGAVLNRERVGDMPERGASEFVRWLVALEQRDFISAQIVLRLVANPATTHADIARVLSDRFGTILGINAAGVSRRVKALAEEWQGLGALLAGKVSRRGRTVTYGVGEED